MAAVCAETICAESSCAESTPNPGIDELHPEIPGFVKCSWIDSLLAIDFMTFSFT